MTCQTCGAQTKYTQCIKCKSAKERDEAYALGYQQGYLRGEEDTKKKAAEAPSDLTLETWRRLNQLCHPDKHGGSEASQRIQEWLIRVKPK